MKKLLLTGALVLATISLFAVTPAQTIHGVKLYHPGFFPKGRTYNMSDMTNLTLGTWNQIVHLAEPVVFKDNGFSDGKGHYVYYAKVDHTVVGSWFVKLTNSAAARSLLKITIPYKVPLYKDSVYKFTDESPLTVLRKENCQDSDGSNFSVYDCVYNGKMTINGTTYPQEG